ncbi:hypothetical protein KAI46_07885 [bacterium]|nr:hypothetical protein [bacterium]
MSKYLNVQPAQLFIVLFSLLLVTSLTQPVFAEPVVAGKVIVYYFHGDMRCRTCNRIESYTKETVKSEFAKELADGLIEIRIVNTDDSENEHFIKDFQLTNRAVVLVENRNGELVKWSNLNRIWLLVSDKDSFQFYIEEEVKSFMDSDSKSE